VTARVCLAHPEHSATVPIQLHRVRPLARGGWASKSVQLCANAHGTVHALLDEIEDLAVTTPYASVHEVVRALPRQTWADFPPAARLIAYHGWKSYGIGFLNGRYAAHHRYWRTDGTAKTPGVPMFADTMHAARWSRRWSRELERL
jgi:hypothetical protein